MSDMLDDFRREHEALLELCAQLGQIDWTDPKHDELVERFRARLMAHLQDEDDRFYPALFEAAEHDARLARIASVFAEDCKRVTEDVIQFFTRATSSEGKSSGATDFQGLLASLRQAILDADDHQHAVQQTVDFFAANPELWHSGGVPANFGALMRLLRERVHREETILFPLYQRFVARRS